jgi:hypothetical protein
MFPGRRFQAHRFHLSVYPLESFPFPLPSLSLSLPLSISPCLSPIRKGVCVKDLR